MWRVLSVAAVLVHLLACSAAVRNSTTTAIETLAEPDNAAAIAGVVAGDAMRAELALLVDELVSGTLDAATSDEAADRVSAWSERIVDRLSPALAASLEADLGPAVRAELRAGISDAIATAAAAPNRERVALLAKGVTTEVADALLPRLKDGTDQVLREAVLPALEDSLARLSSGDRSPIRQVTAEAMLGIADALEGDLGTQLRAFTAEERQALLAGLDQGASWLEVGLGALSAVLFGAFGLTLWSWARRRREADRAQAALRLLTASIKDLADAEGAERLLATISERGRNRIGGVALREFLVDHDDLRVDRRAG